MEHLKEKLLRLEQITLECRQSLEREDFAALNQLLDERKKIQGELIAAIEQIDPVLWKKSGDFSEFRQKVKNLTKDFEKLVEDINARRKAVAEEVKKLRQGETALRELLARLAGRHNISKIM